MQTNTGRCSCDSIHYEITGEPLFTHACHCSLCQRRSGSAFGLSMLLEASQFKLTRGETTAVEITADSGNKKHNHFCASCGTVIFGSSPALPGLTVLRPGTLDDTSRVKVQAHIWVKSRQPWFVLPDDVPCFETMYDRGAVWPESSLRRYQALS